MGMTTAEPKNQLNFPPTRAGSRHSEPQVHRRATNDYPIRPTDPSPLSTMIVHIMLITASALAARVREIALRTVLLKYKALYTTGNQLFGTLRKFAP